MDHNGLNNTRANLRKCSRSLNCANKRGILAASGYRGVTLVRSGRWRAAVGFNRVNKYLGTFDTAEAAAVARDNFVFARYGEFAILNFPIEQGSHQ